MKFPKKIEGKVGDRVPYSKMGVKQVRGLRSKASPLGDGGGEESFQKLREGRGQKAATQWKTRKQTCVKLGQADGNPLQRKGT